MNRVLHHQMLEGWLQVPCNPDWFHHRRDAELCFCRRRIHTRNGLRTLVSELCHVRQFRAHGSDPGPE